MERDSIMRRRSNGYHEQTQLPIPTPASKEKSASAKGSKTKTAVEIFGSTIIFLSLILFVSVLLLPAVTKKLPSLTSELSVLPFGKSRLLHRQNNGFDHRRETHPIKYVNPIDLQSSHLFDVIVVGCGPAGITAAMFAARMGMSVLVVGSPSAGSLSSTATIDNFPSFFGNVNGGGGGQGWIDSSLKQASYFGAQFANPTLMATSLVKGSLEHRTTIEVHLGSDLLTTEAQSIVIARAVIIATGSTPRKLNLVHETSLWGHSLHNCALCDGDAYVARGGVKKSVAVIGGGDAAVEAIFLLHRIGVESIHWIHRRDNYRANPSDVERIRRLTNVEIWAPYIVVEWVAKGRADSAKDENVSSFELEGIRIVGAKNGQPDLESTSSIMIPCDGAFLMIGSTPNSDWLKSSGIEIYPTSKLVRHVPYGDSSSLSNDNTIPTPVLSTSTSINGVFAAGEVVDGVYRQAITAAAQGATAAIDVQRYLRQEGFEEIPSKRSNVSYEDWERKDNKQQHTLTHQNQVECDLTKSECINSVVSSHPVVVFSKSYCPFCRRAVEVLRSYSVKLLVLDLVEIEHPSAKMNGERTIQDTLELMTGRRTVPNVFVGGVSIGGGDETVSLHLAGKLLEVLQKSGALSSPEDFKL